MKKTLPILLFSIIVLACNAQLQIGNGAGNLEIGVRSYLPNVAYLVGGAGQSNMDGRADTTEYPSYFHIDLGKYWVNGTLSFNNYYLGLTSETGQGNFMAITMNQNGKYMNSAPHLIEYAFGGRELCISASDSDWSPWHNELTATFITHMQNAETNTGQPLQAIAWCQGEADSRIDTCAANYQVNLTALIARFRDEMGNPTLPFIIARTNEDIQDATYIYTTEVTDAQDAVAATVPHVYIINTNGLPTEDGLHFNYTANREIGRAVFLILASMEQNLFLR